MAANERLFFKTIFLANSTKLITEKAKLLLFTFKK